MSWKIIINHEYIFHIHHEAEYTDKFLELLREFLLDAKYKHDSYLGFTFNPYASLPCSKRGLRFPAFLASCFQTAVVYASREKTEPQKKGRRQGGYPPSPALNNINKSSCIPSQLTPIGPSSAENPCVP